MENIVNKEQEGIYMDNLLQEAYEILNNSENLNTDRAKLTRIFNRIAAWKEDNSEDAQFYEAYQKVLLSMAQFDFSKRLAVDNNLKSIQNFFSVTLNSLNDELEENLYSKKIVTQLLKELPLQNIVVIGTNVEGKINFFHTDQETLFPEVRFFIHQNINIFFEDMQNISDRLQKDGLEKGTQVQLKFGYKGKAHLKIASPSWLNKSEGLFYIVKLPESL